jgi:hypothetical protein
VNPSALHQDRALTQSTESQAEGWKSEGKGRQFHRHKLQGQVYVILPIGLAKRMHH